MTRMHVNTCYCILLNITAYTIVIEPGILATVARIMDYQMRFKAHLRDASGKGGDVCSAHHIYSREAACGTGWRYGPSCPAIAVAVATAPIATTTTSQELIQAQGLENASQCTL